MPTYNPKDILVSVNAVGVTGYADGADVISIDYESDFIADAAGVTGEAAFVEMNDRRATVTLKILATALQNDVFSAVVALGAEFIVSLTDANGTTVATGASCRFLRLPEVTFGNEVGEREWVIRALEWIEHVGGTLS